MKYITAVVLLSVIICLPAFGRDDDVEFAISLYKAGFSWLAEKEFASILAQRDTQGKIHFRLLLARLYEKEGNEQKRNSEYEKIISLGKGLNLPEVEKVEKILNSIREKNVYVIIRKLEGKEKNNIPEKEKKSLRAELEKNIDGVISFYTKKAEECSKKNKRGRSPLMSLAKAHYYKIVYKDTDIRKHRQYLQNLNDTFFKPIPQEETVSPIDIPFFRGLAFEQMNEPEQAALTFIGCLRFPVYPSLYRARRSAYFHAVSDFFKAGMHKECAETAFVYMDQFPVRTGYSASSGESLFASQVNASMDILEKTDPAAYSRVVRLARMRTNAVMTVRATRVSVDRVRRYEVTGSGGSSAIIEMPEQKVTKVNTTAAVPCR